jgi:hypothetical protein
MSQKGEHPCSISPLPATAYAHSGQGPLYQDSHATYRRLLNRAAVIFLYACALLQFVRFYVKSTTFYLSMPRYMAGTERLPFQERILPAVLFRPMLYSPWVMRHLASVHGVIKSELVPFYILSLFSCVIIAVYTQKLYNMLTVSSSLRALVFPILLFTLIWTYALHLEANYSYPYDLPSVAFFAAGVYFIYARRFPALFLVILVGSFNRETTLFLIGIYILDAASAHSSLDDGMESEMHRGFAALRSRFDVRAIPWTRVALLSAIWLAIKIGLARHFEHNDASEDFLRVSYNLDRMGLRLLPALLNLCGYSVPLVVLFWSSLRPRRFANYFFILVPWFAIMFCAGVLIETRIYGELCPLSAVALVLLLENRVMAERAAEFSDAQQSTHGPFDATDDLGVAAD